MNTLSLGGDKLKDLGGPGHNFSTQVTVETLKLSFTDQSGTTRSIPDIVLPRVVGVQAATGWMIFTITGKVQSVFVDAKPVLFQQGKAYWQVPANPAWER